MLQHTGQLVQGFLSKEQCDNTAASPDLVPANFYLFPLLKLTLKGVLLTSLRMRRRS